MNWEKIAWWIFWLTFGFVLAILFFSLTVSILTATSVELAYLLGLVVFLIYGNKLIFGYGSIASVLDAVIQAKQVSFLDKEKVKKKLEEKGVLPLEKLEELSFRALILIAFKDLDYYRYAYYGAFLVIVILTILTKFHLLGELVIGKYVEGVFWGGVTATFFVWGLETLAKISFAEYISLGIKEEEASQS